MSLSVSVGAVELDGDTPCGGRGGVARATRGAARSFWFDFAVLSVFFFFPVPFVLGCAASLAPVTCLAVATP